MKTIVFYFPNVNNFDPSAGGVQRILGLLRSEIQKKDYVIYFLTNQTDDRISPSDYIFYLPKAKINSKDNVIMLKSFIINKSVDIFVNHAAYCPDSLNLVETIKHNVPIITAHHNCIKCLYDKYTEIFSEGRSDLLVKIVDKLNIWNIVKTSYLIRSYFVWRKGLKMSKYYVVYFEKFKQELYQLYKLKSDSIACISNPSTYKPDSFINNKINKNVLFVGRIEINQKRVDKLLVVIQQLHEKFYDWNFTIVGEGSYLKQVRKIKEDYNLNRVIICGKQDPYKYFIQSDILLLTSDYEGFAMVLIEAQALGVVPVAFRCYSAIDEVILNNESGYIIDNFSSDEMIKKVSGLIENDNLLQEMKKKGIDVVTKYSIIKISNKWISLFENIK